MPLMDNSISIAEDLREFGMKTASADSLPSRFSWLPSTWDLRP